MSLELTPMPPMPLIYQMTCSVCGWTGSVRVFNGKQTPAECPRCHPAQPVPDSGENDG